ncbi:MAG: hypothetical protein H6656_09730 [Ardenticatenaceae bacterium]|nr:hypothetical protein [Ardenticatenaceae bacterium]
MSITKHLSWQKTVFVLLNLILVLVLQGSLTAEEIETPDAPSEITTGPAWDPIQNLSGNTFGSRLAVVRGAPNGRTVMVGFVRQMSATESDTDVYYRRSTNNGAAGSWSLVTRIHSSGGVRSTELDLDYDSSNKAHAVWVENGLQLHYAHEDDWASNTSAIRSTSATGITNPRIIASGSSNIDIVWAEFDGSQWQIFHTRSKNGGTSWAVAKNQVSVGSLDFSTRPALAVSGNTIYVVWEEGLFTAGTQYSQGTVNTTTNTVTWTTARTISTASGATNAKQPQITLAGNTRHVAYTERFNGTQQYIHHIQCSSNCTGATVSNNWQSRGNPISGQVLGVHASNPFDLTSTISQIGGCTFVYFHGLISGNDNEQIWGTSSCGNWATSPKDEITDFETRAIFPNMDVQNNWWVYLVFEEFVSEDIRQIRFLRNVPATYIPFLSK